MNVSIVIPTKNRAQSLGKVLPSYINQDYVKEIIIVDDGGNDTTAKIVSSFNNTRVDIRYIRHDSSLGAAAGRITGYTNAVSDYVLFGEDDAFLSQDYVAILLNKLIEKDCAIISGQIIYMKPKETIEHAFNRFGNGISNGDYISFDDFMINTDVVINGDILVPFTHALFLSKKKYLLKYGYDPAYGKGNGFREETDFQIACFCDGLDVVVTPEVKCYHMSRQDVKSGGQRVNHFTQIVCSISNTHYLYKKYYKHLSIRLNLNRNHYYALLRFINKFILKRYAFAVLKKLRLL